MPKAPWSVPEAAATHGVAQRATSAWAAPLACAAVGRWAPDEAGAASGLERGLVPVPAWVVIGLGAFIVLAVLAYLTVRVVVRRRGLR